MSFFRVTQASARAIQRCALRTSKPTFLLSAIRERRPFSSSNISKLSVTFPTRDKSTNSGNGERVTDDTYHRLADKTIDRILDSLDQLGDDLDLPGYDVTYSSGVLTLKLGNGKGTYVINKQPPNKQIWLSSPASGPKRYDYDPSSGQWIYLRDGSSLSSLLNTELSMSLGVDVKVLGDQVNT